MNQSMDLFEVAGRVFLKIEPLDAWLRAAGLTMSWLNS